MPRFMQVFLNASSLCSGAVMCQACQCGAALAAGRYGYVRPGSSSAMRTRSSLNAEGFPGAIISIVCPYLSLSSSHPSASEAAAWRPRSGDRSDAVLTHEIGRDGSESRGIAERQEMVAAVNRRGPRVWHCLGEAGDDRVDER